MFGGGTAVKKTEGRATMYANLCHPKGRLAKADDLRHLFAILPQIPSVVLPLCIQRSCRANHGNLMKVRAPPKDPHGYPLSAAYGGHPKGQCLNFVEGNCALLGPWRANGPTLRARFPSAGTPIFRKRPRRCISN